MLWEAGHGVTGTHIRPRTAGHHLEALRAKLCPEGFCVFRGQDLRKGAYMTLSTQCYSPPSIVAQPAEGAELKMMSKTVGMALLITGGDTRGERRL